VPIDYRSSKEERRKIYDSVNAIYIPGDSQMALIEN
jgi:hypothetical protein